MTHFDYKCISCSNALIETGLLLTTEEGAFVCCDVCRTLYYIDTLPDIEGVPTTTVEPADLDEDEEFDIIRQAHKRIPLKEYLYVPNERNINPHLQVLELKSFIDESMTPSDLIRKLQT